MTVCVAAICADDGPSSTIVTASDRQLTWGHAISETALKAARIAPRWLTMIAGDDITLGVEDMIRHTRATLSAYQDEHPRVLDVQAALMGAWRDKQNQIGESAVLNPFRVTVDEFRKNGREQFGTAKFLELAERLQVASKLHCAMLVCGFDENKIPALLVCDDDVPCRDFTRADFMAIGSGHAAALASLAFHEYTRQNKLETAIYQVCAAKFMAERSPGVGKDTMVLCLRDDGKTKWIFKTHVQLIRELWDTYGRPKTPTSKDVTKTIAPIVAHQPWLDV